MSGGTGVDTIVGSGFDMPYDMLLRKQEVTCMYESPNMMDDYNRKTLKDMRPLKPLFESDQARGGTDERGSSYGNNISRRFISFRDSGFQTEQGAEPYLPDGTFLDHQFLENDPRGVALEPDMRKHVYQQYSRASLINFKDDTDNSVPESGINPWDMNANVRATQNYFRDYFKNFETSKDSWGTSGFGLPADDAKAEKLAGGIEFRDPARVANRNLMNITNSLSNDTSIGFRRTTDHEFKVAQYGKTNMGSFTNEDWYKNRANAHIDHDVTVSWNGLNLSKDTALKMIDLSRKKHDAFLTGLQGMQWDESKDARSTKFKLTPSDMAGMAARKSDQTQPDSANTILKSEGMNAPGRNTVNIEIPTMAKTIITMDIADKISSINRRLTTKQKDDLRNEIEQTASDSNLYLSESNKKHTEKSKDLIKLMWDTKDQREKNESRNIANYRNVKTTEKNNMERVEHFKFKDQKTNEQRRGRLDEKTKSKKNPDSVDNDFGRDISSSRMTGGMGSKYMTPFIDGDGYKNDLNDV